MKGTNNERERDGKGGGERDLNFWEKILSGKFSFLSKRRRFSSGFGFIKTANVQ